MENLWVVLVCIAAIIGLSDFPRRHPDTLAPIQLITLNGIAALVLLLIANAVATTYWWMLLPPGPAAAFAFLYLTATVLSAITAGAILLHRILRPRRPPSADVDAWMQPEVDTLKRLVCGRHGIKDIHLYRGTANGTEVEVIKTPAGAGIRVGGRLPEKLAHSRSHFSGGPRRVRTLIRFILLHELGHLLNGDHLAYQFARAVLLAQLWYLAPLLALLPLLVATMLRGATRDELAAIGGMALLLLATTITVFVERIIVTRFASARERLADWRATVTLTAADRARLLCAPPDDSPFLEKALATLRPPPVASVLGALLSLTWPQSQRIDARVRQLIVGHSKGRHEPLLWSALAGLNVGVLVVLTISLTGPLANAWGKSAAQAAGLWIAAFLATLPATILVGRADPTDPLSHESASWERRISTAGAYVLAHAVVVIAGYLMLYAVPPLSPLQITTAGTVIVFVTFLVAGSAYLVGTMIDLGPAVLRRRGELPMQAIPFLFGLLPIIPLSLLLERVGGGALKQAFSVLFLPTVAVFFLGTAAVQSRYRLVRRLSPLGVHRARGGVVRIRALTVDVTADMNDIRRRPLFIRLTVIWMTQTTIAFAVIAVVVLVLSSTSPDQALAMTLGLGMVALLGLALWPTTRSIAPTRLERNIDTLHALFLSRCTGPLRALLERLKPSIADDLRTTLLRDTDREPGAEELCRAAQRMELANAIGATDVTAAWIADAADVLRQQVSDGVVRAWRGGPPSAYWTAWAARLAAAAGDTATARSLAQAAAQLLPAHCDNPRAILVAATVARLNSADEAPLAPRSADIRQLLRSTDSLSDLAAIGSSSDSDGVAMLRQTVRSRLWTTLHANSRRQLLVVLDLIDAGNQLGEGETSLWCAAEERLCDLLLDDDEALLRRLGAPAAGVTGSDVDARGSLSRGSQSVSRS